MLISLVEVKPEDAREVITQRLELSSADMLGARCWRWHELGLSLPMHRVAGRAERTWARGGLAAKCGKAQRRIRSQQPMLQSVRRSRSGGASGAASSEQLAAVVAAAPPAFARSRHARDDAWPSAWHSVGECQCRPGTDAQRLGYCSNCAKESIADCTQGSC